MTHYDRYIFAAVGGGGGGGESQEWCPDPFGHAALIVYVNVQKEEFIYF
jgi:hypothetical protein